MDKNFKLDAGSIAMEDVVWQPDLGRAAVLGHINLKLASGEFYGILGPNGAGKTSLVRQILKLQKRDGGKIWLGSQDLDLAKRREIGLCLSFLPQNIRSDTDFSVFDVAAMGREPHRKRFTPLGMDDVNRVLEALAVTNCTALKEKKMSNLSGGERQRVMTARTIVQDTPWIFLDEPVSNLDVKHQAQLMAALKKLQKKGKTIVAILHDINLAAAFCTRMILMKEGRIYAFGTPKEVLTRQNLQEVYEIDFDFLQRAGREMPYIVPKIDVEEAF